MGRDCPNPKCGGRLYYGDCTECGYRQDENPNWARQRHDDHKRQMDKLMRSE